MIEFLKQLLLDVVPGFISHYYDNYSFDKKFKNKSNLDKVVARLKKVDKTNYKEIVKRSYAAENPEIVKYKLLYEPLEKERIENIHEYNKVVNNWYYRQSKEITCKERFLFLNKKKNLASIVDEDDILEFMVKHKVKYFNIDEWKFSKLDDIYNKCRD